MFYKSLDLSLDSSYPRHLCTKGLCTWIPPTCGTYTSCVLYGGSIVCGPHTGVLCMCGMCIHVLGTCSSCPFAGPSTSQDHQREEWCLWLTPASAHPLFLSPSHQEAPWRLGPYLIPLCAPPWCLAHIGSSINDCWWRLYISQLPTPISSSLGGGNGGSEDGK